MEFEVGRRYTLFSVGGMGFTFKREITVRDEIEGRLTYSLRKKRKLHFVPQIDKKIAVFEGWEQPVTCDSDPEREVSGGVSIMMGNACFNFIGTPEEIKAWIESLQINPDFSRGSVLAWGGKSENPTVVFPEEYHGGHAVIDGILDR